MRLIFAGIIITFLCNGLIAQQEGGMPSEPGYCFSQFKCYGSYHIYEEFLAVKEGIQNPDIDYEIKKISIDPELHMQLQRLHPVYADSILWSKEVTDEQSLTFKKVAERNLSNTRLIENHVLRIITLPSDYVTWLKVICSADTNNELLEEISYKLFAKGYLSESIVVQLNGPREEWDLFKNAINLYQEHHSLCIGDLSLEFLAHIGINTRQKP